jgi:hypothetical protein
VQRQLAPNRVILLIAVSVVLALIVLSTAVDLLPPPPGPPTPTSPPVLDRAGEHLEPRDTPGD